MHAVGRVVGRVDGRFAKFAYGSRASDVLAFKALTQQALQHVLAPNDPLELCTIRTKPHLPQQLWQAAALNMAILRTAAHAQAHKYGAAWSTPTQGTFKVPFARR